MTFDPDGPATDGTLFGLGSPPEDALVHVIPVPFEATTSYRRGTRGAPTAILEASAQVDLCDPEVDSPWRRGIALLPGDPEIGTLDARAEADALAVIAAGGPADAQLAAAAARVDACCAAMNQRVLAQVERTLAAGAIPAVLGGDHSVAFGGIVAAAAAVPGMGVLQVDAHCDLRVAYEGFTWSHASVAHNVLREADIRALVQVGVRDVGAAEWSTATDRDDIHPWHDAHLSERLDGGTTWATLCEEMIAPLPDHVWVSFDVDGLDPSLCPGTGTPVPGGLTWRQAMGLLRSLSRSGRRIIGFDLCEVGVGEWDAIVGARLLYKLAGWAGTTWPVRA